MGDLLAQFLNRYYKEVSGHLAYECRCGRGGQRSPKRWRPHVFGPGF